MSGFHLMAFSADLVDSTADQTLTAVADAGWAVNVNGRYIAPFDVQLIGAAVTNDAITRARINSPGLRDLGLPEISPLNVAAAFAAPMPISLWDSAGPRIRMNDEFGIDATIGAATDEVADGCILARKVKLPVPPGERVTIRGTAAQTLVAGAWTIANITFDQQPPVGRYAVIGMQAVCNDASFARLVFPEDQTMRPGAPVGATIAAFNPSLWNRFGNIGEWGRFNSVQLPQLEVFGHTAGAETPAVILDLVRIQ